MNTADRELMQQALDALQDWVDWVDHSPPKTTAAITALRNRLAQCDRCGKKMGGDGDIHTCTPLEQKRFELWWDAGDDISNDAPYTPDTPIQFAWAGWQAALAQLEQEPDPIGDAQDRLIAEMAAQPEQEPDLSEQGRNRSAVLENNIEAIMDAGLPFFEEAVAAVDNTLHHAIDHWQDRAMKAEALLAQPEQEPVAWMYQCTADNSGPVLLRHRKNWAKSGTGLWIETPLYTTPPAAPVQPEHEQWDAIPDSFNDWWNADYDDAGNAYRKDSPAYWAWAGWKAASKQPEQEPVQPVAGSDKVICPACCHPFRAIPENVQRLMLDAGFEPPFTTPPAAQHQCKWPTCQSEEYQQALAEQINRELVSGAAQPAPVQEPVAGQPCHALFAVISAWTFQMGKPTDGESQAVVDVVQVAERFAASTPIKSEWHTEAIAEWNRRSPAAQRQPLSQYAIDRIIGRLQPEMPDWSDLDWLTRIARAIEAAHGIKGENT